MKVLGIDTQEATKIKARRRTLKARQYEADRRERKSDEEDKLCKRISIHHNDLDKLDKETICLIENMKQLQDQTEHMARFDRDHADLRGMDADTWSWSEVTSPPAKKSRGGIKGVNLEEYLQEHLPQVQLNF